MVAVDFLFEPVVVQIVDQLFPSNFHKIDWQNAQYYFINSPSVLLLLASEIVTVDAH